MQKENRIDRDHRLADLRAHNQKAMARLGIPPKHIFSDNPLHSNPPTQPYSPILPPSSTPIKKTVNEYESRPSHGYLNEEMHGKNYERRMTMDEGKRVRREPMEEVRVERGVMKRHYDYGKHRDSYYLNKGPHNHRPSFHHEQIQKPRPEPLDPQNVRSEPVAPQKTRPELISHKTRPISSFLPTHPNSVSITSLAPTNKQLTPTPVQNRSYQNRPQTPQICFRRRQGNENAREGDDLYRNRINSIEMISHRIKNLLNEKEDERQLARRTRDYSCNQKADICKEDQHSKGPDVKQAPEQNLPSFRRSSHSITRIQSQNKISFQQCPSNLPSDRSIDKEVTLVKGRPSHHESYYQPLAEVRQEAQEREEKEEDRMVSRDGLIQHRQKLRRLMEDEQKRVNKLSKWKEAYGEWSKECHKVAEKVHLEDSQEQILAQTKRQDPGKFKLTCYKPPFEHGIVQTQSKSICNDTEEEVEQLLLTIKKQVELDTTLREAKQSMGAKISTGKYDNQIAKLLAHQGFRIAPEQVTKTMLANPNQINPFSGSLANVSSIEQLVEIYCNAQNHFLQHIRHSFSSLAVEEFLRKLCFGVNEASIEDLVRLINMELGTYFRNRDLVLVMERIRGGEESGRIGALRAQLVRQ